VLCPPTFVVEDLSLLEVELEMDCLDQNCFDCIDYYCLYCMDYC